MTDDTEIEKPVEVKKEKSESQKAQDFVDEYNKLTERMGYKVVTSPAFIARDDGTFSLILQYSVGKIGK